MTKSSGDRREIVKQAITAISRFPWSPLHIFLLLAVYVAVWLPALNLINIGIDDPCYTDPAASLYFGHGFRSGMWPWQRHDTFWASNLPLYQFILYLWFHVVGFSYQAVRFLALAFFLTGTMLAYFGGSNFGLLPTKKHSAIFLLLVLLSSTAVTSITFGRPDSLCFLIAASLFYCSSLPASRLKYLSMFILGCAAAWCALQLAAFLCVGSVIILVLTGKRHWKELAFTAAGGVLGLCLLLIFYHHHHVLDTFIKAVAPFVGDHKELRIQKTLKFRWGGMLDHSMLFLSFASLTLIADLFYNKRKYIRRDVLCLLLLLIGIPVGMNALGFFPVYYSWMVFIPVSVIYIKLLSAHKSLNGFLLYLSFFFVFCAIIAGIPRVVGTVLYLKPLNINVTSNRFAASQVKTGDVALVDTQAYYGVRPYVNSVFFIYECPWRMDKDEIEKLSLLLMSDQAFTRLNSITGNNWQHVAGPVQLPNYNFMFLPFSKFYAMNSFIEISAYRPTGFSDPDKSK